MGFESGISRNYHVVPMKVVQSVVELVWDLKVGYHGITMLFQVK